MGSKDCFFVSNTSADSVEKLLAHKRRKWEHEIVPSRLVDVARLKNLFQEVFKNFKTKN